MDKKTNNAGNAPEKKYRFAPSSAGMGHRGPGGGGPGGHGRFGEKPKLKNARGTIIRLLGYLREAKWFLVVALLALIFSTVATLTTPMISGNFIDAITRRDGVAMLRMVLTMLALYVLGSLFSLVQSFALVEVAQRTVRALRKELFGKIQALPLHFFDSRPHGELMSRLTNDVDNISNMLGNTLTQVLSSAITVVVSLVMMLYLSPILTVVSVVVIPISMFLLQKITKVTSKLFRAQQASLGELNGIVEENVTGARVVKVFCRENAVMDDFRAANDELTEVGTKATIFSSAIGPLMNAFNNIGFALVAGIGGLLVVTGRVGSIGMIQSFLQYSRQFQRPINELASLVTVVQSALAGAERVFEIIDTEPEPADATDAVSLQKVEGHVEFDDVSFGYTPEKKVLKDVTFDAKPGQTIALVGPTGAGKTTIVNLLMRFYDIDSGDILIDGHEIKSIKRRELRNSLGMVLQDVYLFSGTVRDNIAYGKLNATEEEIIAAAKMANCHSFITRLPNGYDTVLSEDGSNLSQGQRQLLSIARAILANPSILILDEATSSVDTRTEMNIQLAMLALMKGRTSFVIAHRLSTIRGADMILVLNNNEIIERGTHEQLVAKGGFYADLLNSQYRAALTA